LAGFDVISIESIDIHKYPCISMDIHGYALQNQLISVDIYCSSWLPMGSRIPTGCGHGGMAGDITLGCD